MVLPHVFSSNELKTIASSFFKELQASNEGRPSSIPFLIHTIPSPHQCEYNSRIQIMVFGGTIFKTALFQKTKNNINQLGEEEIQETPLFVDKNTFIQFVLHELKENIQHLAINFAYPMRPIFNNGHLDGILLRSTKEHKFEGMVGTPIGKTIQTMIQTPISLEVANDTVCLLLSEVNQNNYDEMVAGIVGTGSNYALSLPDQRMVNLECGSFNLFPLSESGKQIDESSIDKGRQIIEKEIAGAYLYQHYNYYNKKNTISDSQLTSTKQLSEIAQNNNHSGFQIAQLVLERSAGLTAAQMAGIYAFKAQVSHVTKISFVMEGSLFWEGWKYRENVEQKLATLGLHDNILFTQQKHHSIMGALKLLTGLS